MESVDTQQHSTELPSRMTAPSSLGAVPMTVAAATRKSSWEAASARARVPPTIEGSIFGHRPSADTIVTTVIGLRLIQLPLLRPSPE